MENTFASRVIEVIREYCENQYAGNLRAAAEGLGIDPDGGLLNKWLKSEEDPEKGRSPTIKKVGPVMDKIGARVVLPGESESRNAQELYEQLVELKAINKKLERKNIELSGEVRALERQLERFVPSPSHTHQHSEKDKSA